MVTPRRIQRSRAKGWKMPPNTVYVGRPTIYGNDYKAGDLHPYISQADLETTEGRERMTIDAQEAVDLYALAWATANLLTVGKPNPLLIRLRGKNLACWCALDQPCHADVLLELANRPTCEAVDDG